MSRRTRRAWFLLLAWAFAWTAYGFHETAHLAADDATYERVCETCITVASLGGAGAQLAPPDLVPAPRGAALAPPQFAPRIGVILAPRLDVSAPRAPPSRRPVG